MALSAWKLSPAMRQARPERSSQINEECNTRINKCNINEYINTQTTRIIKLHKHTHTHIYIYTYYILCVHRYTGIHTHIYIYMYIYTHMYMSVFLRVCVCMYVRTYVCMYVRIRSILTPSSLMLHFVIPVATLFIKPRHPSASVRRRGYWNLSIHQRCQHMLPIATRILRARRSMYVRTYIRPCVR